jgi:hypothetical protein
VRQGRWIKAKNIIRKSSNYESDDGKISEGKCLGGCQTVIESIRIKTSNVEQKLFLCKSLRKTFETFETIVLLLRIFALIFCKICQFGSAFFVVSLYLSRVKVWYFCYVKV